MFHLVGKISVDFPKLIHVLQKNVNNRIVFPPKEKYITTY